MIWMNDMRMLLSLRLPVGRAARLGEQLLLGIGVGPHVRWGSEGARAAPGVDLGAQELVDELDEGGVDLVVGSDGTGQVPGVDDQVGGHLPEIVASREVAER